jgi:hypothetical protein
MEALKLIMELLIPRKLLLMLKILNLIKGQTLLTEHMMELPVQDLNINPKMGIQMFLSLKMVDTCYTQHKTMFSSVMLII